MKQKNPELILHFFFAQTPKENPGNWKYPDTEKVSIDFKSKIYRIFYGGKGNCTNYPSPFQSHLPALDLCRLTSFPSRITCPISVPLTRKTAWYLNLSVENGGSIAKQLSHSEDWNTFIYAMQKKACPCWIHRACGLPACTAESQTFRIGTEYPP